MFRLIVLLCLLHISVGNVIRGRILFNGDANQTDPIPANSQLFLRLEHTSEMDASGTNFEETEISNLVAFPIDYQIELPYNTPSASSYTLSACIQKGNVFLYVGGENIPVTNGSDRPITIDIPVSIVRGARAPQPSLNDMTQLSWPELVGHEGTYAVQYIKEKTGLTNVIIVPEDSMVTMDYRTDRVRVFVNKKGVVTQIPHNG